MNARTRGRGERGETLVEALATVVIVGTTVVAVMFGLATAINLTKTHRDRTDTAVLLAAAADAVDAADYVACPAASTASYDPTSGVALPEGWSADAVAVTAVAGWDGAAFGACGASDGGLQRVTITVTDPDGSFTRSIDVVKRAPT